MSPLPSFTVGEWFKSSKVPPMSFMDRFPQVVNFASDEILGMKKLVYAVVALVVWMPSVQAASPQKPTEESTSFDWSAVSAQPDQAAHILAQLQAWRTAGEPAERKVLRVVYFHPQDRVPLERHRERWDRIMTDIQDFYRVEMQRWGYGEVTLGLERKAGNLKLHEVPGVANDDGSYSYRSGGRIHAEVVEALAGQGLDAEQETLLIVCGLSKTADKQVTIYSPYYGMGADHIKGVCFVADVDWLSIDGLQAAANEITLQVKEHRDFEPMTLSRFNTIYIGGTIHELGHGLSLPHNHATQEGAKRGTALMGAGNYTYRQEWRQAGKGSFLTHAHALRLLVHPLFSGTAQQAAQAPQTRWRELEVSFHEGEIHVRGKLQTDIPAIAVIAYNDRENSGQKAYQVNNDYDATTWSSVVSPEQTFWLRVGDLQAGQHQLRLVSVHANGAALTHRLHYTLEAGIPDFRRTRAEIAELLSPSQAGPLDE